MTTFIYYQFYSFTKTDVVSSLKSRFISACVIDVCGESSSGLLLLVTSVLINSLCLPISAGI